MNNKNMKMFPVLIDLDGILRIGKKPAGGIKEFFEFLVSRNYKACILSNSTLSTSGDIVKFFHRHSLHFNFPVLTAVDAAAGYVKDKYESVAVYCAENVKHAFGNMISFESPGAVVIGDIGSKWNYEIMNEIFNFVFNGADLIAMHKNKFWKDPQKGLLLDAGAFIAGIEYATDKNSTLIGKPSPLYFKAGLNKLGYNLGDKFIMIGDDLMTDIKGAQDVGGISVLVYTGKTKYPLPQNSNIHPDFEAMDLFEVINVLKKI